MNNPIKSLIVLALLLLLTLVSCNSKSEEEVIQEANQIAERTFTSTQTITPISELDHFSLYIPKHLEVEEVDESNIILSDTEQTYIVFHNKFENSTSELNYHLAENDNALLLESFQDEDKFGYISILSEDEDKYEIQVGVGGVKITTYTDKKSMVNHAEELMKIALSIV